MADPKPKGQIGSSVFEKLVEESGLSPIFARSTLKRAVERVGINIETMTNEDLERAWPSIKRVLETFLPPGEARLKGPRGGGRGGGGGGAGGGNSPNHPP